MENGNVQAEPEENLKDVNNKNVKGLMCIHCPSKILQPEKGIYSENKFDLPTFEWTANNTNEENHETITEYWLIDDINNFDNISVTRTVDNYKYFACADCERGPIGYFDICNHKSYIALSRVRYA